MPFSLGGTFAAQQQAAVNPVILTGGGGTAINDPFSSPQTWDILTLAGVTLPGIVYDYDGFDVDNGWQIKKGKGSVGGTLTYVQKPPAEGHFIIQLFSRAQFQQQGQVRQIFLYNPSVAMDQQAISMSFPPTDDLAINSVVVKKISPIKSVKGAGGRKYLYRVDLIQFLPTPPTSVVATTTYTNANNPNTSQQGQTSPATAPQTAKALISGLLSQMQSTP